MERIIVGIDDELASVIAARWAARRASGGHASIELVMSIDELMTDPVAAKQRLDAVAQLIAHLAPTAPVNTTVLEGSIPNAMSLRSEEADLMVIGSHRSRPLASALTGSLPIRIAADSRCPVVIVPDDWREPGADGPVLVGLEADGSSDAALDFAAREAVASGRELIILHSWRIPPSSVEHLADFAWEQSHDSSWNRAFLADSARDLAREFPGLRVTQQLTDSFPEDALAEVGRQAALVVVGSHRYGPVGSFIIGSTARDIMHGSSTPVCVVGPKGTP